MSDSFKRFFLPLVIENNKRRPLGFHAKNGPYMLTIYIYAVIMQEHTAVSLLMCDCQGYYRWDMIAPVNVTQR